MQCSNGLQFLFIINKVQEGYQFSSNILLKIPTPKTNQLDNKIPKPRKMFDRTLMSSLSMSASVVAAKLSWVMHGKCRIENLSMVLGGVLKIVDNLP